MTISVAAAMAAYNRKDKTIACLESLERQHDFGGHLDVFVLDDASTDGTDEAIQHRFPWVNRVRGTGGLFYSGGMRWALRAAFEGDYDFYLWMNDDVVLDDDALVRLMRARRQLRDRGIDDAIIAGSMRDPDTNEVTYGGVIRPSRYRPLRFRVVRPQEAPQRVETMNGNLALVPRSVSSCLGAVDPAYSHSLGDFDYGLRATAAGFSVWVAPGTFGECELNPPPRPAPRAHRWRELRGNKGLPPKPWFTFARRWAGPLWVLYWLNPYVRRSLRILLGRAPQGSDQVERALVSGGR